MVKKVVAIIALVMIASLSIAGCTSSTNSNQAASSASQAASSAASTTATSASTTTKATTSASATPSATPSSVPTPSNTPSLLPSPTPKPPTPTPAVRIATTTQVWAHPVVGPDTIFNPGPGMGANIAQGTDWWYCRAVVNAADGTHPCGLANWYIDDQAAGGVWSNNAPGVNGLPGCSAGMGGGFAKLELHSTDTLKLSVGYHTLKCDYLGDNKYAPSEWVGRIYIAAPLPTPT